MKTDLPGFRAGKQLRVIRSLLVDVYCLIESMIV